MWVFALFLAWPLIEIGLFVTVGGWLTLWPTLAIVLLTGVLGAYLVRWQGMGVLRELQSAGAQNDPLSPLAHGALILIGGFMLLLPGFLTDVIGLCLMVPAIRSVLIGQLGKRIRFDGVVMRGFSTQSAPQGDWVDAAYHEVPPEREKIDRPSKWTED